MGRALNIGYGSLTIQEVGTDSSFLNYLAPKPYSGYTGIKEEIKSIGGGLHDRGSCSTDLGP